MKAVNLIPGEERRGGSAGGHSAATTYGVLGALAVIVLMVAAWTLTGKKVSDRRADLARVEQQAGAAESQASRLAAYSAFSDLRKNRADTVASIARSRFDWAHVMHEIARVIPSDTHLLSLAGSVSPSSQPPAGGGSALQLRGSSAGPAIDIVGCATGQANVARMMSRLRLIDGVQHVTLSASEKNDPAAVGGASAGGGGSDSGDCRYNSSVARFDVLMLFAAPPAVAAPGAPATGAATTASTTGTTTTGGSQ